MPTERFNHLAEEKKQVILEAAVSEFVRVPFEKASINKIIQNAGISRGSFYTYFEDKRDVLRSIFSDSAKKLQQIWELYMEQNQGDLWRTAEDLLDYMIAHARKGDMFQLMQNIMLFQDADKVFGSGAEEECSGKKDGNRLLLAMYEVTDKKNFRKDDLEYFGKLMSMILAALIGSMGWYYRKTEDSEKIKKVFHEKLEILQHGICKQ